MRVRSSPFPALTSINSNSELSHLQTSTLTSVNPNSELSHLNSELSHEWSSDVRVQSSFGVPHRSASSQFDYNALRRPTAALNDRTGITNDSRHIDRCQTVRKVQKSCDMCPFGPLGTWDTSTRFASRRSPTRPQRTARGTASPSQPGRTIEPPKRGLPPPRSSEVEVTVPLRTFAR